MLGKKHFFERVAAILIACEEKKVYGSFQTGYGGVFKRHRLEVEEDRVLFKSFIIYSNAPKLEEKLTEIEKFLKI